VIEPIGLGHWAVAGWVAGYAVLALGTLLLVLAGLQWRRRGWRTAGALLVAGAVWIAVATGLTPPLVVAVERWASQRMVAYPVQASPRVGVDLGWGVVVGLVGIVQVFVAVGARALRS